MTQRGFTLLEILVALAVLAIALSAAIKSAGTYLGNEGYLKERTLAHWVAMNKVAELRASGQWPKSGETKGDASMGNMDFLWTIKVTAFEGGDVRRLDVRITPEDAPDRPLTSLIAFVGKPL